MGGIDDYISLSSRELGDMLDMSQQSASKRILELLENNLIDRDLGARKQRIKITSIGHDALRREYNDYRRIFELTDHIILHGNIKDGMGEGGYYINQPGYMRQFEEKLGYRPYFGTLNVAIDKDDVGKLDIVKNTAGILISGFTDEKRTFGDVIAYKAKIRNTDCAIVIPARSQYVDVIEIVCKYHLRRTLSLSTDDRVDVHVEL
ncbi:MAG: DUF120 domain-containing protein [Thermoplasmata archaeon]|nr:DUF120 domain-containing protein [Thermoplasmata archaeon]